MIETIGYISSFVIIIGVILNVMKHRSGFAFWIVGNSFTLVVHYTLQSPSMMLRDILFIGLAFIGLLTWRKPPS